jgi:RNA polymerase-interacting CarD/CdnL/TRCF family regulator
MLREDDLDDTIRPTIRASRAKKILEHIRGWKGTVSDSWKPRALAHEKKLEQGDPKAYAEVYKTLRQREKQDKLSVADRRHLEQAKQFLAQELAEALDKSIANVSLQMAEAANG